MVFAFVIISKEKERVSLMKKTKDKQSKMTLNTFIRALFTKETPNYIKAIIVLALAYTVFPIDMIPDFLGPLGFADDAAVIGLLTTIAMTLLNNYNNKMKTVECAEIEDE